MKIFLSHSKLERYFFLCGYIIFFNAPSCQIVAEHFPSCILSYFKKYTCGYYLLNIRTNHILFCLFFMDENAGFFMRIISLWIYWILTLRAKSCKTPPNWKWIINKFLGHFYVKSKLLLNLHVIQLYYNLKSTYILTSFAEKTLIYSSKYVY